jgi:hypothetical protein
MRAISRILVVVALGLPFAAGIQAQSLASLAKKNKAGKPAPAGRTFTNEDLQQANGAVSTSRVPDSIQAAARPKGNTAPKRRSAPPAPAASAAGNRMTPVAQAPPIVRPRIGSG